MRIVIDKEEKTPVYLQIQKQIRDSILTGNIRDGYRLPSERKLAQITGVHRNTITRAYTELKAENLITSKQGRGYIVNYRSSGRKSSKGKSVNWKAIVGDQYSDVKSSFDTLYNKSFDSDMISFAGGRAAREPYQAEETAEVIRHILDNRIDETFFSAPAQGNQQLREMLTDYYMASGIAVNPSEIQIFADSNQALHFVLSLMLNEGEKVILNEVSSPDLFRTIEVEGGEIVALPEDNQGLMCENIEALIEKEKPSFFLVDSGYNNPTGRIMSEKRKKKLLDLSYRYRIPIIEIDETSELYYEGAPPTTIKAMDSGSNVIYINSLVLTMVPGLGISAVVADREVIKSMRNMASLHVVNVNWISQIVTLEYMKQGVFFDRFKEFRSNCREKRDLMCTYLDQMTEAYKLEYEKPAGGVFIWVRIAEDVNTRDIMTKAWKRGVAIVPGYIFHLDAKSGNNYFRLNFSYPSEEEIKEGMALLEEAIGEAIKEK